jgi:hypothetical protein
VTREYAIGLLTAIMGHEPYDSSVSKALDMAISALREQEERSKGCEHCRSEINRGLMLAHGYSCCTDCGRRLEEV